MDETKFKLHWKKYGIKLVYDQIDTSHGDMCFSNITIIHSVYKMNHVKIFEAFFGWRTDYRQIVLILILIKNDVDWINECGYQKMILIIYVKSLKTH